MNSNGNSRPFRLWDAKAKKPIRFRYFRHKHNAHVGALIEARWAAVGTTIEVHNKETGRLLGQYTRRPSTVSFSGGDNS